MLKKVIKVLALLLLMFQLSIISFAQFGVTRNHLLVGDTMPDYTFTGVKDFPQSTVKISDFRGKWLILDLWNKGCLSCIESFPKVESLRKEFSDQIQIIMVGLQDKEKQIESLYEKHRNYYNLRISHVFDSAYFNKYDITAGPYIIIISPEGKIKYITTGVKSSDLNRLLGGEELILPRAYTRSQVIDIGRSFDPNKPFLVDNNGGGDTTFLFRSVLAEWKFGDPVVLNNFRTRLYPQGIQVLGVPLRYLYNYAYFGVASWTRPGDGNADGELYGKVWPSPILILSDSSDFDYNPRLGKGAYSYSLIVPPDRSNLNNLKRIVQNDLANYFGFNVRIEERDFPYWEISVNELKTGQEINNDTSYFVGSPIELEAFNISLRKVQEYLAARHGVKQGIFLYDKKLNSYKFSFHIKGRLDDFYALVLRLAETGIIIKAKKKKMLVLIIGNMN